MLGLGLVSDVRPVWPSRCTLSPIHAGLVFPVEKVDRAWLCRLHSIIDNATTTNTVGPIRVALPESLYRYLLDRPPLAATLIRRLGLGVYSSEFKGLGRFWGDDGAGTKGIVELVYEDPTSRIYVLEGTHESRILPDISGKAVVFLRMGVVRDSENREAIDTTMAAYTRLDNRVLSGLVSLLRPLIGGVAGGKLKRGIETVNRLGMEMRQSPEPVLSKASEPPALSDVDVAFLRKALGGLSSP
ncbi:MAG: hypothetical protein FJ247_08675 [Nitrospira sp.]|nr:hypothetical protein [Nitrospira sp.]